mmetsp:Transcript_22572/g.50930  ORF Transcript_22572/g.50930 Transcript_22572/m.50930 type:complete len:278 (-) Transcript_22572:1002-1835(-)
MQVTWYHSNPLHSFSESHAIQSSSPVEDRRRQPSWGRQLPIGTKARALVSLRRPAPPSPTRRIEPRPSSRPGPFFAPSPLTHATWASAWAASWAAAWVAAAEQPPDAHRPEFRRRLPVRDDDFDDFEQTLEAEDDRVEVSALDVPELSVGDLLAVVALEEDDDDDFEEAVVYEELGQGHRDKAVAIGLVAVHDEDEDLLSQTREEDLEQDHVDDGVDFLVGAPRGVRHEGGHALAHEVRRTGQGVVGVGLHTGARRRCVGQRHAGLGVHVEHHGRGP